MAARPDLAKDVLYFGESLLDGIQVRRVGGQEHELCSALFDELSYPLGAVCSEPVEHHNLPLTKLRSQEVFYVDLEDLGVRGALDTPRLSHPAEAHGGYEGSVLAAVFEIYEEHFLAPK